MKHAQGFSVSANVTPPPPPAPFLSRIYLQQLSELLVVSAWHCVGKGWEGEHLLQCFPPPLNRVQVLWGLVVRFVCASLCLGLVAPWFIWRGPFAHPWSLILAHRYLLMWKLQSLEEVVNSWVVALGAWEWGLTSTPSVQDLNFYLY